MCWMCDNPSLTRADYRAWAATTIAKMGWCLQYVEAEDDDPSLVYTVGLTGVGKPELVAQGLTMADAADLNEVAKGCISGEVWPGDSVLLGRRRYLLVPELDVSQLYLAQDMYGGDVRALRMQAS